MESEAFEGCTEGVSGMTLAECEGGQKTHEHSSNATEVGEEEEAQPCGGQEAFGRPQDPVESGMTGSFPLSEGRD